MFLIDWLYGLLGSLGLHQKEAKILFFRTRQFWENHSAQHAQRSSFPYFCFNNCVSVLCICNFYACRHSRQHQPTQHPTSEELCIGKIKFNAFDLGGHFMAPGVWKDYYLKVDGVVFLVDASDKERFEESRRELNNLLIEDALSKVPMLVLGNKIDIAYAVSEDELRYYLGFTQFTTGKGVLNLSNSQVRPLELFMCSISHNMGYGDGFGWLSQYMK